MGNLQMKWAIANEKSPNEMGNCPFASPLVASLFYNVERNFAIVT
jgi:hypothetical protein